jgi:integrase
MATKNDEEAPDSDLDRKRWLDFLDDLKWEADATEDPTADDRCGSAWGSTPTLRYDHPVDFDFLAAWLDAGDNCASLNALAAALLPNRVHRLQCCNIQPDGPRWHDPLDWKAWRNAELPLFERRRADLLAIVAELRKLVERSPSLPEFRDDAALPLPGPIVPPPANAAVAQGQQPAAMPPIEDVNQASLVSDAINALLKDVTAGEQPKPMRHYARLVGIKHPSTLTRSKAWQAAWRGAHVGSVKDLEAMRAAGRSSRSAPAARGADRGTAEEELNMVAIYKKPGRKKWSYKVKLASGLWSGWRAGFTSKRATEHHAVKEQELIDCGKVGLVDRFAEHRQRPIAEHVDDYVSALQGRNTTAKHCRMTRARLEVMLGKMRVNTTADLNVGLAEVALGELLTQPDPKGRLISPKTRDHYAAVLVEFGGWLANAERIESNPFAKLSRISKEGDARVLRQALDPEQVHRLVAAAEVRPVQAWKNSHPGATAGELAALAKQGRRRGLLYLTAALTGLRRGELASLRWCDLKLGKKPTVTARASTTKSKERAVLPLDHQLAERLRSLRKELAVELHKPPSPRDAVFRIPKNITEQIAKDATWADIEVVDAAGRRLDFHALRGTAATMMALAGVPVQIGSRLIRHKDIEMTRKHYEKVETEDLRPGVALLGAAFWNGGLVGPPAEPCSAPLAAAVGCSAPLAEAGTMIAQQTEVASERHATPIEGAARRSVPVADELWRRRESNPRPRMLRPVLLRA